MRDKPVLSTNPLQSSITGAPVNRAFPIYVSQNNIK